jgi:hypothetical protein
MKMTMTMDEPCAAETDRVEQARALLAAAADGVKRLENASSEALCRFVALTGIMARLETLAVSPEPDAADAAALDAATVCRETTALLRYIDGQGTTVAAPSLDAAPVRPRVGGPAPARNGHAARRRGPYLTAIAPEAHIRADHM